MKSVENVGTLQFCVKLFDSSGMRVSNFQPIVRVQSVVKDLKRLKLKFNEKFGSKKLIVFNKRLITLF